MFAVPGSSRRTVLAALLAACLTLVGCRAVVAGAAVGAVAGFVVATSHYDYPPHHHAHHGHYYYLDAWHPHPPRSATVEIYFYRGTWYRRRGHPRGGPPGHRDRHHPDHP